MSSGKFAVKAPSVGESIAEVSILKWAKSDGEYVKVGDLLLEVESDKATVEIVAERAGTLSILKPAGERILIGALIAEIDESGKQGAEVPGKTTASPSAAVPAPVATMPLDSQGRPLSPAVNRIVTETGLDPKKVTGTGKDGRLVKGDVLVLNGGATQGAAPAAAAPTPANPIDRPGDRRVAMTNLRARIADRLVAAQHTAAILTTFNEVDLTAVNALRAEHKEAFKAKHGVALSFMSFFSRASVEAMKIVPEVNASIDGRDVIYHDYVDLGIAVGTERGLVVPILKNAEKMDFVAIEKRIAELAIKARDGKLAISDISGGTFT
ncbi:MAG: 2-oxo acid dehydrogenase subunit E2, partial [Bdellovibrionota bacterium]